MDTAKVSASLAQLSGVSFSGPRVSPQDRSPGRRSAPLPSDTPLYLAWLQGEALVKAKAIDAAKQQLAWIQRFGHDAGLDSSTVAQWVQSLKDSLP